RQSVIAGADHIALRHITDPTTGRYGTTRVAATPARKGAVAVRRNYGGGLRAYRLQRYRHHDGSAGGARGCGGSLVRDPHDLGTYTVSWATVRVAVAELGARIGANRLAGHLVVARSKEAGLSLCDG